MREITGFNMTQTINVVDAMCGAGKTSWAIQMINDTEKVGFGTSEQYEKKYIYVTPFLDEVDRIQKATDIDFFEPEAKGTKIKSFEALITLGKSVATTHELFKRLDLNILDVIEEKGYTLIMDEVASVLEQYDISKSDINLLINNETIEIGENDKVVWLDDDYKGEFSDMKILAQSDNLILQNGVAMFWTMNTRAFEAFDDVYILTYLFDAQSQCNYYKANDIKFKKYSVKNTGGIYELIDYDPKIEPRKEVYEKLNIYLDDENNKKKSPLNSNYDSREKLTQKQRYYQLSSSWFRKTANPEDLKQLNNNLRNYFRQVESTENKYIFWTTISDFAPKLKNAKCKWNKNNDRTNDNFVALNARATNSYGNCTSMAYVYNRFVNPMEKNFFREYEIEVDEDKLAVSDLIQFLFRGCIRNNEPMNCYIPAERMRTLLKRWADFEI
ncbi:hypothetical protein SRABI84_02073 [Peribacillus simplex]|uniref:hypothetical protein n=1 Tax=Peribacillus simplex TaxID=1478 RepID=UPI001D3C3136|nr:hypothetical protein [Peribacillus simplex]CAH0208275.1 hypothetical protein SRABI84_02073 [Peribacillus simplex]